MRTACLSLLVIAALAGLAPAARADGIDAETRRRAEIAFYEGRLWALDEILRDATGDSDRLPLLVRDAWWRGPVPPTGAWVDLVRGDVDEAFLLLAARNRWLGAGGGGDWPVAGDADDPYPLLTALIQDRLRRELVGSAGLPEDGPIEAWWLEHEQEVDGPAREVFGLTYGMMVRSYRGDADPREERALDRQARTLANRNKLLWLGLLGALMSLSFIAALVVGRSRS